MKGNGGFRFQPQPPAKKKPDEKEFQISKSQIHITNYNDRNSKFQTIGV